jgi:hypothetical protein
MPSFYERLGVPEGASEEQVREGYHKTLARLVKKLRSTRERGGDVAVLESQRDDVREAFEVLTDPQRRRRYQLFLRLDLEGLPREADELWEQVQAGLVDPTSSAAVEVVRALTQLDVGQGYTDPANERTEPAAPPSRTVVQAPPAISMMSPQERLDHAAHATQAVPEPASLPQISLDAPIEDPAGLLGPIVAVAQAPVAELDHVARHLGHDGNYLRSVRESQQLSVDELSANTRIAARYIEAIEGNAFDRLPAAVFVRGYLREIAAALDVDEGALVEGYMALYNESRGA